jgi:hypothetical protein
MQRYPEKFKQFWIDWIFKNCGKKQSDQQTKTRLNKKKGLVLSNLNHRSTKCKMWRAFSLVASYDSRKLAIKTKESLPRGVQ